MDISSTIEPKSDQQNFDDYQHGPKTVTIEKATRGGSEQPVSIHLVEYPGRPFKPSKSMRRVLVAAWGKDADAYAGRRLTLYGDPTVRFGGEVVGGIRISHMSDISQPLTVSLTVSKGKRKPFTVEPLAPERAWLHEIESATTTEELRAMWPDAPEDMRPYITARVADLQAAPVDAEVVDES